MTGAAQELDQLIPHHLDDLLPRREGPEDFLADGLLPDAVDEALDDLEVDVRLEQRDADLAKRLDDVLLGKATITAEAIEDRGQTSRKVVKHGLSSRSKLLETLKDNEGRPGSQADFATSAALRSARTARAGSDAPKIADPATRISAPAWARRAALAGPTPPSTDSSTGRVPTSPLRCRSFA